MKKIILAILFLILSAGFVYATSLSMGSPIKSIQHIEATWDISSGDATLTHEVSINTVNANYSYARLLGADADRSNNNIPYPNVRVYIKSDGTALILERGAYTNGGGQTVDVNVEIVEFCKGAVKSKNIYSFVVDGTDKTINIANVDTAKTILIWNGIKTGGEYQQVSEQERLPERLKLDNSTTVIGRVIDMFSSSATAYFTVFELR